MRLKYILWPVLGLISTIAFSTAIQAQNPKSGRNMPYGNIGWSTFLRGGYLHQFKTDIDNGGEFSVDRFFVQGGVTYSPQIRRSVSLAFGYGYDGYDFSDAHTEGNVSEQGQATDGEAEVSNLKQGCSLWKPLIGYLRGLFSVDARAAPACCSESSA